MRFVIYRKSSGEITKSASCPDHMVSLQYDHATEDYLEHEAVDDRLFYFIGGTLQPRPELELVISGTTITGIPNPTTVITDGTSAVVSDGVADLTFSQSGTYTVQLYSFPYVGKVVEVTQL